MMQLFFSAKNNLYSSQIRTPSFFIYSHQAFYLHVHFSLLLGLRSFHACILSIQLLGVSQGLCPLGTLVCVLESLGKTPQSHQSVRLSGIHSMVVVNRAL